MKKLPIILVFLPIFGFGQLPVTAGLKYHWNSTIEWSDSTLYDSSIAARTDIKLIDFDGDSAQYVQGNAYGSITFAFDTIDIPLAYVNYALGDSLFFKWEESVDSANGKQQYPWRLVEIAWYSSALTGTDLSNTRTYFYDTIDFTDPVFYDGAGYIQDSVGVANHGDTLIIKPGVYLEDNPTYGYLLANKRLWYLGVGQVELTTNDGTYIIRNAQNDNKYSGIKCYDSGGNSAAMRTLTNTNMTLDRFITQDLTTPIIIQGLQDTLSIQKSIINGSSTSITVRDEDVTYIDDSYITGLTAHNKVSGTFYNLAVNNSRFDNQNLFGARGVADIAINSSDIKSNLINSDNNDNSGVWKMAGNNITCESFNIINADSSDYDSILFEYCDFTPGGITSEDDEIFIRFENQPYVSVTNCNFYTPFYSQNTRIEFDATIDTNLYHIFDSNYVQNRLKSNFVISWGNQNYEGYNSIMAQANRNKIHNFYYFYPDSAGAGSHTMFFVNNSISEFKYNRINGGGLGIVHKSQGLDCSNSIVQGNLIINCNNALESKGSKKVKYYNNTIYNDLSQNSIGIYILKNSTELDEPADSCELYNNIIADFTASNTGFNCIEYENDQDTLFSNYNQFYTINNRISNLDSSFVDWQTRGYDLNSYNSNPLFSSSTQLWPTSGSDAISNGLDLGAPYNLGLNTNSVWPDGINLKQQVGTWDIGAFIIDKTSVTTSGKVIILIGNSPLIFNR